MRASRWHSSPAVDLSAYAFSWLFVLVPLSLSASRESQVAVLLLVVGLTFAHRHYTLPYVYLDREVFGRFPRRFLAFPIAMFVGFVASPFLWNSRARVVVATVVFAAGAWNVWHVYMQKYGILRLYAAKSDAPTGCPRYVDRFLLFCWVPLYLVWLVPSYRDQITSSFPTVASLALPVVEALRFGQPYLLAPAAALVVLALTLFVWNDWRALRLRNAPRLWMALGTTGLSASFLVCNPVHVFIAFAFNHAVEYMVFVWAFQRRRYAKPLPHDPLLGRVLRHPWIAYGGFTLAITAAYLLARFWGYLIVPEANNPMVLGTTVERWAFYWSVFQSLLHFYYDGFLWKMRLPSVQANL